MPSFFLPKLKYFFCYLFPFTYKYVCDKIY